MTEILGICGVCWDQLHPKCSRQDWRPSDRVAESQAEWELMR